MKKIIFFLALGCALAVSCKKENGEWGRRGNSAIIGVNVSDIDSPATKADAVGGQLFDSFVIDTIGGRELKLEAYVSDYNPDCPDEETKGAITTTGSITKFWMNAYAHDTWYNNELPDGTSGSRTNPKPAGEYFSQKVVSRTSTSTIDWSIADSPVWINDIDMSFWSWAGEAESSSNPNNPAPGLTPGDIDLSNNKASISYTTNGNLDLVYAFNKENRKFNEKTGEITEGSGTYNTGYKDAMDIKFHHALSAIRFDISNLKESGLTIKKVTFRGVVNQATCEITADPSKTGNPLAFAWTPKTVTASETNKADLSMEFNASEDFTATGVDGTTADALMPMTSSKFLFFIPQTVKDAGIKVVLTYSIGTATETTTSEVTLSHDEAWEPGKYYTYRLNAGAVKLALTGTSPAVNLKNTGSTKVFIRAAIVANWCMEDTANNTWYPLSECPYSTTSGISYTINTTSDDTITGGGGHWELKSDGYWYYTKAIDPDTEIPLLTAYSINGSPAHVAGTTLRLTVIGQAVKAGDATDWAGAATVSN